MHFQSERDSRRREVIARLADAGLHTRVYESSGAAGAARAAALVRLTLAAAMTAPEAGFL